jgi:DNA-binding transcriptional LysR family regulator
MYYFSAISARCGCFSEKLHLEFLQLWWHRPGAVSDYAAPCIKLLVAHIPCVYGGGGGGRPRCDARLPDTPPSPTSVYVLYPRSRQLSLRVRVFIDWVANEYASHVGSVATADIARSSHLLAP